MAKIDVLVEGYFKDYNYENKLIFKGYYKNGLRNGNGCEYLNDTKIFEGNYVNGLRDGEGKEYLGGKLIYIGKFKNGVRYGEGKEYLGGKLIYSGKFKNGVRYGDGKVYDDGVFIKIENYELTDTILDYFKVKNKEELFMTRYDCNYE